MNSKFKKIIYVMFILGCLAIGMFAMQACGKDKSEYSFSGLKTVHLSLSSDASHDFKDGVTGFKDGQPHEFSVDLSKVKFDNEGKYFATYQCGKYKINVPVYIYGQPAITASDIRVNYLEASNYTTEGVTAKDSFGKDLEVCFSNITEPLEFAGAFEYGVTYIAKYEATDAAGQTISATRELTVSTDYTGRPEFAPVTVDLSFVNFKVDLDGGTLNMVLDESGNIVPDIVENNGAAVGFGNSLRGGAVGQRKYKIFTSKGYNVLAVTLTDNQAPAVEYDFKDTASGVDGYIYKQGEIIQFPSLVHKFGSYQNFTVSDGVLTKKNGGLPATQPLALGEYEYSITVTKGGDSYDYKQTVSVLTDGEYLKNSNNTLSTQFLDNFSAARIIPFVHSTAREVKVNSSVEYAGAVTDSFGTTYNAVLFDEQSSSTNPWSSLLLSPQVFEEAVKSGRTQLSFDVLFAEDCAIPVGQPGGLQLMFTFYETSVRYWGIKSVHTLSVPQNSDRRWTRIVFDLSTPMLANVTSWPVAYTIDEDNNFSTRYTAFGIMSRVVQNPMKHKLYFANIQYKQPGEVEPEVQEFYDNNYIQNVVDASNHVLTPSVGKGTRDAKNAAFEGLALKRDSYLNINVESVKQALSGNFTKMRVSFLYDDDNANWKEFATYINNVKGNETDVDRFSGTRYIDINISGANSWNTFALYFRFQVLIEEITFLMDTQLDTPSDFSNLGGVLSWGQVAGNLGYQIQIGQDGPMHSLGENENSYTLLSNAKVRVRAINNVNVGNSPWSAWITVLVSSEPGVLAAFDDLLYVEMIQNLFFVANWRASGYDISYDPEAGYAGGAVVIENIGARALGASFGIELPSAADTSKKVYVRFKTTGDMLAGQVYLGNQNLSGSFTRTLDGGWTVLEITGSFFSGNAGDVLYLLLNDSSGQTLIIDKVWQN